MNGTAMEVLVWASVCGIAAWWIVRKFVLPWQQSKDKSLDGRAHAVLRSLEEEQLRKATVFGSRRRTVFVSLVNITGLVALLFAGVHLTMWVWLYPLVGFAVLRVLRVRTDRRLFSEATSLQRFDARLYQSWSWPVIVVMVLGDEHSPRR